MAHSFSPEFRLATACAIWPPSNGRTESIRDASAGPLDWDRFLQVVKRHRVAGLVQEGLTRAHTEIPAHISSKIAAETRASLQYNLASAAEASRVWHLFTEAHLPVMFIKGVSLAVLAYGNIGLRHSRDIDLLVPAPAISEACGILERCGYRRSLPPPNFSEAQLRTWLHRCKEICYIHDGKQLVLELHSRLFDNSRLLSDIVIDGPLRIVSVTKEISLPTLGNADLFAYLCAHGAVCRWFRLKWLADIGALLAQQSESGIEQFYLAAEARGAGRSAAEAMLLCSHLLGTTIPERLLAKLRRRPGIRWLETTAFKAMSAEQIPPDLAFGTTWSSVARFLLGQDWRYWLAELNVFATSPNDILMLPLGKSLRFLYPILRLPLWVWRHNIRHLLP